MELKKIINVLAQNGLLLSVHNCGEMNISSISCDSRRVNKGALFFVKGVGFKPEYLYKAFELGAVCYVAENEAKAYDQENIKEIKNTDTAAAVQGRKENSDISDGKGKAPFIRVSSVRKAMPIVADLFYNSPARKYMLTGITGTKGKTTVTYMLKNIFSTAFSEDKTGIISTNEALCGSKSIEKTGTTPEALELYGILNDFSENGIKAACMEVSSQGLQYNRVDCIDFFNGIYLNLSPDHISSTEHKNFEEYKNAKMKMLTLCKNGIVNIDDGYAEEAIKKASCKKLYTIGIKNEADFRAEDIILSKYGVSFRVRGKYLDNELFELKMPGEFNVYNALAAIAASYLCGCKTPDIKKGLKETRVKGRMEIYEKNNITVIVDYAHNQLSLEAVFGYVEKMYPDSKILCLFGCQGNKAYDRRVEVPKVVGEHADFAILTSDDPENEEPEEIMNEVEIELKKTRIPYVKIEDREQAVNFAVSRASSGDVVILAGKGHETTQKVRGKLVYYKGDLPSAIDALN